MCLVSHWNKSLTFTTTSFAPFFSGRFLCIRPGGGLRPTTTSGVADFLNSTGFDFCGAFANDWPEVWLWEGWWSGSGDLRIGFGFGTLKIIGCTGDTDGAGAPPKGLSSKRCFLSKWNHCIYILTKTETFDVVQMSLDMLPCWVDPLLFKFSNLWFHLQKLCEGRNVVKIALLNRQSNLKMFLICCCHIQG